MSVSTDADYLHERAGALEALRSARRANQISNIDWFEAFYKAYVGVILIATGLYLGAGWLGDEPLTDAQLDELADVGAHYLGIAVAVGVAIALRSAGRGGPLAFELADVRHVLLAPVDRYDSVRSAASKGLRHATFIGGAAGGAIGVIAARRLPEAFEWVVSGAVFGGAVAMFAYGAALACSGLRMRSATADVIAVLAICWAAVEIVVETTVSPFGLIGHVAVWPADHDPLAFAGLAFALLVGYSGLRFADGISLESAERRSGLVGQLRFAATTQDIRTVMLIQRQLAQQQLRSKPWVRVRPGGQRGSKQGANVARIGVFTRRSMQGMLRWPLLRIMRLVLLVAVAAVSLVGVWAGTTPLFVVAGLALWIAALDLLEPLAQEADRPDRVDTAPAIAGLVHLRLLVVPTLLMLLLTSLAAVPLVVLGPGEVVPMLIPTIVSIVGLAVGGAALVVTRRPGVGGGGVDLIPEVAGVKLLWQLVVPPGLAVFGFLPIALARNEWFATKSIDEVAESANLASTAGLAFATWCFLWVRYADGIRNALASAAKPPTRPDQNESPS